MRSSSGNFPVSKENHQLLAVIFPSHIFNFHHINNQSNPTTSKYFLNELIASLNYFYDNFPVLEVSPSHLPNPFNTAPTSYEPGKLPVNRLAASSHGGKFCILLVRTLSW
jgi:hypothetical protein